jgi:hypothetical protein
MDWVKFEQEMWSLSERIDFDPDVIIGISRGGLVPALYLSKHLGVNELHGMSVTKEGKKRRVFTEITKSLKHKRVLLVEDMLETGESLIVAKKHLEEDKDAIVKTACLYTMRITKPSVPDYFIKQVKKVVDFPWEDWKK